MSTVVNIPPTPAHAAQTRAPDVEGDATRTIDPQSTKPGYGYRSSMQPHTAAAPPAVAGSFLPMLLGSLALLGWLGFQCLQLLNERQGLQAAYASQQQTVENAGKLRNSLDALAADTQRMADGGNANAKLLVDELRKRGITINTTPNVVTPATSH